MKNTDNPSIINTNDEGLRRLTHEQLKVFAKFTSDSCEICEQLAPPFAKFACDAEFDTIQFLRLDSDENPVAKKLMQQRVAPFFASYCQGQLLECDSLTEEQDVHAMLRRLRDFQPLSA